jgi:CubicO group peptidase (beta-lactamase class C family)
MRNSALIDKVLASAVSGGKIAGLVALAADAEGVVYRSAFGLRTIGRPQRMTVDTVFRIASMTKAVTAAAAMQLVENGKLSLDQPAQQVLPFLAETKVLTGFDDDGAPVLRAPRGTVTLRNLLTHTAGFVYDTWNKNLDRYARQTGLAAWFRPRGALGVRHQHRYRRPHGGSRQRHGP